ncbi:MAG TPA: hypothetical protein VGI12_02780 [Vicinamibacterales bacterium]|jgi:hypothetical protein
MSTPVDDPYRVVLADLHARRKRISEELAEIESTVAVIERILARSGSAVAIVSAERSEMISSSRPPARAGGNINFANMSVRWAVLGFLAEEATGPMGSGALANALRQRGLEKQGPSRFGNVVSAVISNLKAKGEIEAVDGGLYQLTAAGRAMWAHIRASAKFRISQGLMTQDDLLVESA